MAGPRIQTAPIHLTDGWTGFVTTSAPTGAGVPIGAFSLPGEKEWALVLERLLGEEQAGPERVVLKQATDGSVFRTRLPRQECPADIVVKRRRETGWRRRAAFALRGGRERRNFRRAIELIDAGLNVPLPLAWLQRSRPGPETCAVSLFVAGLSDLDRVVMFDLPRAAVPAGHRLKCDIIDQLVTVLARLRAAGWTHRDLKASNVMVSREDASGTRTGLWLVDLDGVRAARSSGERGRWAPVVRLGASLASYAAVTRADRLRFVKRCLGEDPSRQTLRAICRDLADRVAQYNRRARTRKSTKLDGFSGE